MFGRGKDDKFSVVDIYDVLKDIRNPLNLKCSILQSNDCSGKLDKVMFSVFQLIAKLTLKIEQNY